MDGTSDGYILQERVLAHERKWTEGKHILLHNNLVTAEMRDANILQYFALIVL